MDIYYFSFNRFPSEKAHALYMAKVCESLSIKGNKVELVVPKRLGRVKSDYAKYYNMPRSFKVVYVPCLDLFGKVPFLGYFFYILASVSFVVVAFFYSLFFIPRGSIVFSSEFLPALVLSFLSLKVIYEVHDYPEARLPLYRWTFRRMYKIQTNNAQKINLLTKDFSVPANKIYFAYNGIDLGDFNEVLEKSAARKKLGLDPKALYVIYTGHLFDWKGADVLAKAAPFMDKFQVLFIGGTQKDVVAMKKKFGQIKNIAFLGHKPHVDIPIFLQAADVLVLPNTGLKDISKYHTSPMKLFEYMASRRPIVASDLPSIREILSEETAGLVEPDNPSALAKKIKYVINHPDENKSKSDRAFWQVHEFTWDKRADKVIKNIV